MAFGTDFGNTHHIYVAYTYEQMGEKSLKTTIVRFTYNPDAGNINHPLDLITGLSGSSVTPVV